MKKFIILDSLKYAWEVFRRDVGYLLSITLIYLGLTTVLGFLISPEGGWSSFVIGVLNIAISIIMQVGVVKISLNYTYNTESNIGDLFSYAVYAPRVFLGSILYGLAIFIGLLFLIVPGIYLALRFSQFQYFIIDKDMGILDSFKYSSIVTKDAKIDLLLYFLLLIALSILSVVTAFLGMLILMPVFWLASAFIYRELVRNTPDLENYLEEYSN
jgi:hypothetical protein